MTIEPWFELETDYGLWHLVKKVRRVFIAIVSIKTPVEYGVLNPIGPLKFLFKDYFACMSVPESHYVETINCSEDVAFLLPHEVLISSF